jgi:hypothetical protein
MSLYQCKGHRHQGLGGLASASNVFLGSTTDIFIAVLDVRDNFKLQKLINPRRSVTKGRAKNMLKRVMKKNIPMKKNMLKRLIVPRRSSHLPRMLLSLLRLIVTNGTATKERATIEVLPTTEIYHFGIAMIHVFSAGSMSSA